MAWAVGGAEAFGDAGNVAIFFALKLWMGLGFTFYSGAIDAWLVDALNVIKYRNTLDQVFLTLPRVSSDIIITI